jgi:hypothetical protein
MSAPVLVETSSARASLWLDAPSLDGRRTAAIGGFECADAASGAVVLRMAMEEARARGFGAVIGPMDGNTWAKHRLVVDSDGRPPFLMEPANPAHFVDAFDQSGLSIVSRYVSAERPADVPESDSLVPAGLVLRNLDAANAEDDLKRIHALSLSAFTSNTFYQPISQEAFLDSYRPVLGMVDPELVFLAEDEAGALRGFLFAIPDFAQGAAPKAVVLKTYASDMKGAGSAMANAFHARAKAKGFASVIHALMHESNLSATHSSKTGGRVFRRYALWGGRL